MPLFEYVCQDCQREQELLVRGEDRPRYESCGGTRLTKLLSVPATHSATQSQGMERPLPPGSCGSGCGCFPQ